MVDGRRWPVVRSWPVVVRLWSLAPLILVAAGTSALFAYLLHRFPYDGLYGQDSYAYFYQARALLDEAVGRAPQPGALYTTNGLQHWPVGYHLQIIAGLAVGGEGLAGPRLLTVAMAVACPVLVYLLVGMFLAEGSWPARFAGGLVAAMVLPFNATYTRMGLSLMSDIPSLFWALLSLYCLLRALPPASDRRRLQKEEVWWAAACGFAMGLAVLTRYGAAAFIAPLLAYAGATRLGRRRAEGRVEGSSISGVAAAAASVAAFGVALIPQGLYLITHNPGEGVSGFLSGMSISNLFSSGSVSADGTASYAQPMVAFYLINPFWDAANGFLSIFLLPLVLLGLAYLFSKRSWNLLVLLVTWWLIPGLVYADTPYQAHRFVLLYLPAIALAVGLGTSTVVEPLASNFSTRWSRHGWASTIAGIGLAAMLAIGLTQGFKSVQDWVATHSAWQAQDEQVVSVAERAAKAPPIEPGQPHVISFGSTAALYHYTQWPMADLYNNDRQALEAFISRPGPSPGPNLVVVPVSSLDTQWAGTPLSQRWQWLQSTYQMTVEGTAGQYTVYRLATPRH